MTKSTLLNLKDTLRAEFHYSIVTSNVIDEPNEIKHGQVIGENRHEIYCDSAENAY